VSGSLVFTPPGGKVAHTSVYGCWRYLPGANGRRPAGPGSDPNGRGIIRWYTLCGSLPFLNRPPNPHPMGWIAALSGHGIGRTFGRKRPGTGGNQGGFAPVRGRDPADCRHPVGIAWDIRERGVGTRLVSDCSFNRCGWFSSFQAMTFLAAPTSPGTRALCQGGSENRSASSAPS
jgi:hypothetical protein